MRFLSVLLVLVIWGCKDSQRQKHEIEPSQEQSSVTLHVLGTVQDGGSPHIGCKKKCCAALFKNPDPNRKVVSLGVIDHESEKSYLFEATPDITEQMKAMARISDNGSETPDGIFLTHAHVGHYSGLMYLGREALGASGTKVYAMPRMEAFLSNNGPWDQLVKLKNIELQPLFDSKKEQLTDKLSVIPFTVPHRDEYSETVGFKIIGPNKTALFIPDIDKWSKWEEDIVNEIGQVDLAFVDATFFDGQEINNRDISEIPHPFVVESMALFHRLPMEERAKIYFIHFNHTNPLLNDKSKATMQVIESGYGIATFGQSFKM